LRFFQNKDKTTNFVLCFILSSFFNPLFPIKQGNPPGRIPQGKTLNSSGNSTLSGNFLERRFAGRNLPPEAGSGF